jgi:hypothetical protein
MVAETLATTYSLTATGPAQTAPEDGTSAATPLWAGVMALVNQQTPSKPVGFANPALYALGKTNAGYFHDVVADQTTTGGPAAMFAAARGYDLVTGWGSPTCSLITSLAGNSSEHAPTTALPSGFKTWGGQENQCLSTAGERVAAGIGLVSETCNPSFVAQNWVLSYSHGAISPATNTSLCIDGNASTGTVSLEGCNGGPTQTWTVGSTIISAAGNGLTYCLNVEYKPGYPMNVETCAQTPLQTFWPFGFPLAFMNAAGDQCLNNVADGATMDDTNCRPNAGAPPRSEIFVLTESNQIVASGGFTAADATTAGPSSACVNLDGLGQNGTSPYYSSLSTWSCGNGPSTTSQEWYLQPAGLHNGQWSWAAIQSSLPSAGECIDMLGANPNPLTQADVWTCNYTSAQLWQLSILPTDEIGFGGY